MKQTYKLTPTQRLAVIQMYIDGHKMDYIASLFGIARRAGAPRHYATPRRPSHDAKTETV